MSKVDEVATIAQQLLSRTQRGRLTWDLFDGAHDDEFTAASERFTYYVRSRDGDGMAPWVLEVWGRAPEGKGVKLLDIETTGEFRSTSGDVEDLYRAIGLSRIGLRGDLAQEVSRDLADEE